MVLGSTVQTRARPQSKVDADHKYLHAAQRVIVPAGRILVQPSRRQCGYKVRFVRLDGVAFPAMPPLLAAL